MRKLANPLNKNLLMNDATYALRRKVMDIIYIAKGLAPALPRINVRITDNRAKRLLGLGSHDLCTIWIPESTANMPVDKLTMVVLHEIGHAAFNLDHDENCPLMPTCMPKQIDIDAVKSAFTTHAKALGFT